jgi:hypothetical protein
VDRIGGELFTIVHKPETATELTRADGSSGWTRTSNPSVNRQKTKTLRPFATRCAEAPDRELDPIDTGPTDDQNVAAGSRPNPRLDVSKGQEKGKEESR